MKSILESLYNGEVYPFEQIVSHDPEYRPTCRKISELARTIKESLPQPEAKLFDEIENLQVNTSTMHGFANFTYGFRLGILLTLELLDDPKSNERK